MWKENTWPHRGNFKGKYIRNSTQLPNAGQKDNQATDLATCYLPNRQDILLVTDNADSRLWNIQNFTNWSFISVSIHQAVHHSEQL